MCYFLGFLFCFAWDFSFLFCLALGEFYFYFIFGSERKNRKLNGDKGESGGSWGKRIMISICCMKKGLNKNNREKTNY